MPNEPLTHEQIRKRLAHYRKLPREIKVRVQGCITGNGATERGNPVLTPCYWSYLDELSDIIDQLLQEVEKVKELAINYALTTERFVTQPPKEVQK